MSVRDVDVGTCRGTEQSAEVMEEAVGKCYQWPRIHIDSRAMHRAQHFVGYRGWTWDRQEFATRSNGHVSSPFLSTFTESRRSTEIRGTYHER